MNVNFDITLTKGQQEAYALAHEEGLRFLTLVWSRQSGKSVFAEIILIENLLKPKTFSAYVSPTFQLGRKVFKEITSLLSGSGIIKTSNASTLTIETIFDSTLQFFSVEAYTAIRGNTVSGVLILDEAAYYADELPNGENIWSNVLMPITKARNPLTILISTPRGKRGFFYEFYLKGLRGEKGYKSLLRDIYSDSLVTEEFINEIKETISPIAFEQEFLCHFLDSALTFFKGFEECFSSYVFSEDKVWIGVDLSGDGSDATVLTKINSKNETSQTVVEGSLDEKYEAISKIINETNNLQGCYIEINGLGSPMYNEIYKQVKNKSKLHKWETTNSSKEEIIGDLALEISKKNIFFDTGNKRLYSELGNFVVTITKTKKLSFAAVTGHDDTVMSMAIALKAKKDLKAPSSQIFIKSNNYFIN